MSLTFAIYLIGMIDSISMSIGFISIIFTLFFLGLGIGIIVCCAMEHGKESWRGDKVPHDTWCRRSKYLIISGAFFLLIFIANIFVPDKYTLAAMYLVPKLVSNKDVKQIPSNAAKLLNDAMKHYIDKLGDDK